MKKTLLILGNVVLGVGFSFAQQTPVSQSPQNKNVVLEELTGIHCGYCPDGHEMANALAAAHPNRVVLVNVHAGGYATPSTGEPDLRTTDGTALDAFMVPAGYPAGSIQRTAFGTETFLATSRSNWDAMAAARLAEASPVNMAMDAVIDATTRQLTLTVEMYYTSPFATGTNHYLNIGYVQNNFEGPQTNYGPYNTSAILPNGNYLHQHIFRGYLNTSGTWGEAIDASQTGVITRTVTVTIPQTINGVDVNIGQLEFFSFLHSGHNTYSNSQIITAAEVSPSLLNVPNPTASLQSIVNSFNVCPGEQITPRVKVTNSGAEITSLAFSSTINGGAPTVFNWTGSIPAFGSAEIDLPAMSFTAVGTNSVVSTITSVNGGAGILGAIVSKTKAITMSTNSVSTQVTVKLTCDRYGSETSWEIKNSAGTMVASGGPYTDAAAAGAFPQPDVNVTLANNECYHVFLYDGYGDGFDSGYGNGNFEITGAGISFLTVGTFSTGKVVEKAMTVTEVAGISELAGQISMNVYPNPASSEVNVEFNGTNGNYAVSLLDLQGRVIYSTVSNNVVGNQTITVPVSTVASGSYIVKVSGNGVSKVQNVVIK